MEFMFRVFFLVVIGGLLIGVAINLLKHIRSHHDAS